MKLSPNVEGTQEIRDRVQEMTAAKASTNVHTVIVRLHAALATASSRLLTATLDDALAVTERPNMPATTHQWPNWSIALPQPIEALTGNRLARSIARALKRWQKQG